MFFHVQTFECYKPIVPNDPLDQEDPLTEDGDSYIDSEKTYAYANDITGTLSAIRIHPNEKNYQAFEDARFILRCRSSEAGNAVTGNLITDGTNWYECLGTLNFTNVLPSFAVYLREPQFDPTPLIQGET